MPEQNPEAYHDYANQPGMKTGSGFNNDGMPSQIVTNADAQSAVVSPGANAAFQAEAMRRTTEDAARPN